MNNKHQKISSLALAWIMLGSVSLTPLTSCKDYDDDINNLQSQIDKNKEDIKALQDAIKNGALISKVEATEAGYKISFSGTTTPIEIKHGQQGIQGPAGVKGDAAVPAQFKVVNNIWQISIDGGTTWAEVKNEAGQPVKATGDKGTDGVAGKNGNSITIDKDGYICTVDGTTGEITDRTEFQFKTTLPAISYDKTNATVVIALPPFGAENTYTLPTIDALNANLTAITGLKAWMEVNFEAGIVPEAITDFDYIDAAGAAKKISLKKDDILSRGAYVAFLANPTAIDLTTAGYTFSMIDANGNTVGSPAITLTPVKGLPSEDESWFCENDYHTTRAISPVGSSNGIWTLDMQFTGVKNVEEFKAVAANLETLNQYDMALVATNAAKKSEVMTPFSYEFDFEEASQFKLTTILGEYKAETYGYNKPTATAIPVWEACLIPMGREEVGLMAAAAEESELTAEQLDFKYREVYKENLTVDKADGITIARDADGCLTFTAAADISDLVRTFTYSWIDYAGVKHSETFKVTFNKPLFETVDLGSIDYVFGETENPATIDAAKLSEAIAGLTDANKALWDANINNTDGIGTFSINCEPAIGWTPATVANFGWDASFKVISTTEDAAYILNYNDALPVGKYVYKVTYSSKDGGIVFGVTTFTVNVSVKSEKIALTPRQGYFTGTVATEDLASVQYITNTNVTDVTDLRAFFNEGIPLEGVFAGIYGGDYVFVDETAANDETLPNFVADVNGKLIVPEEDGSNAALFNAPHTIAVYFVKAGATDAEALKEEVIRFTYEYRSSLLPQMGSIVASDEFLSELTLLQGDNKTIFEDKFSNDPGLYNYLTVNAYKNGTSTETARLFSMYYKASSINNLADNRVADIKFELVNPANLLIKEVKAVKSEGGSGYGAYHHYRFQITAHENAAEAAVQPAGTIVPVIMTVTDIWGVKDVLTLNIKVMPKDINN